MNHEDYDPSLRLTNEILREILKQAKHIRRDVEEIRRMLEPRLTRIRIQFKGASMPNPGPLTLNVGQTATAVVVGFDQLGNPWTGAIPAATFSIDNAGIASVDSASGLVTGVGDGTANLTGSLTTAEGLALSDVEQVIVVTPPPPTLVLSAIKVEFQ